MAGGALEEARGQERRVGTCPMQCVLFCIVQQSIKLCVIACDEGVVIVQAGLLD
jgi:hypothetical protein